MNTITHEIINYQSNVPIKLFYQRIGSVAKHWHNSIEILFVLSGTMSVTVEEKEYTLREDDILLVNPHHIHETSSPDCSLIVVQIRLEEFGLHWAIPENIQFDCNSAGERANAHLKTHSDNIETQAAADRFFQLKRLIVMLLKNNSAGSEFAQLSNYTCAVELIRELCEHFKMTTPPPAPHSIKYLNRLKSILDYMNQNYRENITLVEMARREFLTPSYLSAFFEKTMGTPLTVYLTNIRLNHAVHDLTHTNRTIEQIAEDNGFSNARSFSTVFQKYYKMRPSEYRKQLPEASRGLSTTSLESDSAKASGQPTREQSGNAKTSAQMPREQSGSAKVPGQPPREQSSSAKVPGQPPREQSPLPFMPLQQKSYLELEHYDFLDKLAPYLENQTAAHASITPMPVHYETMDLGNIYLNASDCRFNNSFKCFCGVSRASELLLPPVRAMLTRAQKEIGFEYIKFHGILDDDMMVYIAGPGRKPELCFTYVDMVLDFLLELSLKPMIQFSFMPRLLAKHPDNQIFQKPVIISEPADEQEWCRLITAFTGHLLKRYGKNRVRTWIFTFWNETLNGLSFDFSHNDTALRLYRLTRRCVKDCDSALTFASTSYSALHFPETNYDIFLDYARKNHCLPDVFLFHFYPVVSDSNAFSLQTQQWKADNYTMPVALSRDKDIFNKFLKAMRAQLPEISAAGSTAPAPVYSSAGPPLPAPVYITEWNFTPSHREWLNDTCFSACYLVRNLLQNFHLANGFNHWCLTDLHQELPMPEALFHGGMGLFTRTGIPKPSYYGYRFLNELYDRILYHGEGCFVTTDGNNCALLLYNYVHFNNLYGHGITFDATPENWQNAFPDAKALEISLTLSGLVPGTYVLTEQYVNPDNGSAYEQWLAMGAPAIETEEENEILKSRAVPAFYKKSFRLDGESYSYGCRLKPHEIRLVKLSRQ